MKFEEILTEYHIPFKTEGNHCRNGWINFDCPFCSKDQEHYRMGFNIEGKYVHCWLCGKHGLVHTLSEITDISYSKCKKLLDGIITKRMLRLQLVTSTFFLRSILKQIILPPIIKD